MNKTHSTTSIAVDSEAEATSTNDDDDCQIVSAGAYLWYCVVIDSLWVSCVIVTLLTRCGQAVVL